MTTPRAIQLDPDATTTDVLIILDRSGSMDGAKADHEGGLRTFVDEQRALRGDVRLTLIQFNSTNPCEVVYDREPLAGVRAIPLVPTGGTPLLDAVGRALEHLRGRLADAPSDQVIVLIVTDGEENASTAWTRARVKALIDAQTAAGWAFVFLGANVDAFSEAAHLGIDASMSSGYANQHGNVQAAYAAVSSNVVRTRSDFYGGASLRAASASLSFTDDQRTAATNTTGTAAHPGDTVTVTSTTGTAPTVPGTGA